MSEYTYLNSETHKTHTDMANEFEPFIISHQSLKLMCQLYLLQTLGEILQRLFWVGIMCVMGIRRPSKLVFLIVLRLDHPNLALLPCLMLFLVLK